MSKPDPKVGMKATWINPEDDPENTVFIKEHLMVKYGNDNFVVASTTLRAPGWIVTLSKNNKMLPGGVNWHFLRPLEK